MSLMKVLKDKTQGEQKRNVLDKGSEGQNSGQAEAKLSLMRVLKDKTQESRNEMSLISFLKDKDSNN